MKKIKSYKIFENSDKLENIKDRLNSGISYEDLNLLIDEDFMEKVSRLFKYTDYIYSKTSSDIKSFLLDTFGDNTRWTDGNISIKRKLFAKQRWGERSEVIEIGQLKDLIFKIINFYQEIEDDFKENGYPGMSKLSKSIENIAIMSLDDTMEYHETVESYDHLAVIVSMLDEFTIDSLSTALDEIKTLVGRIIDKHGNLVNSEFYLEDDVFRIIFTYSESI